MKHRQVDTQARVRPFWTLLSACVLALGLLIVSGAGHAQSPQQQTGQDARPRRAESSPTPTPKPTPTPAKGTTAPTLTTPPETGTGVVTPTPTPDPSGEEIDPEDTIKIETDLVNLNVRVIDRNNRAVGDVRQDDFRVFEDGVQQKIEFISKEEVPISYGLAVDNSGSMRSQLDQVIEAAKIIVNTNKPGDETFLVRFIDSQKIETVQDFTANKNQLMDSLDSLYIEGGQTAVVDAVLLSAQHVARYKKGDAADRRRRVLIVVTDGEDRDSYYRQEELFDLLREEDVQIFLIGFVEELDKEEGYISKSPRGKAIKLIDRLAKESGGRAFYPKSLSELPGIAEEISRDMRTQYVISYYPTNRAKDGAYHTIRVSVADAPGRDKRIALTRSGRTAQREGATPPKPPAKPAGKTATSGRNNP
jgi:Ca-activated chloride channel family protein